jgi:hypothetical protein
MKIEPITMKIDATINPILSDQMLRAWNNLHETSLTRGLSETESKMIEAMALNIIECSKFIALYTNNQNE